jgi:hypothetical protein
MGRAGLRRRAVYLVRPDGYVALAEPKATAAMLASYLDARALAPNDRPNGWRLSRRPGAPL